MAKEQAPPTTHRGLEPQDIEQLSKAHDALIHAASMDCDCDLDGSPMGEGSNCTTCDARRAMEHIVRVLDPISESCSPNRMTNLEERIYVEEWREICKRRTGIDGGYGTLELLLVKKYRKNIISGRHDPIVEHVTQRDYEVATSVIQWLGTNCGASFINQCEQRVSKERGIQRRWGTNGLGYNQNCPASFREVAEQIASQFVVKDRDSTIHRALRVAVESAMLKASKNGKVDNEPADAV